MFTPRLSDLKKLPQLKPAIAILYFQKKRIFEADLDSLERFVFNGGGLLALHSASASFKQSDRYFNLIGGRFKHHGKVSPFQVDVTDSEQTTIFKGIDPFVVRDELYIHEYLDDVAVHFTTRIETGMEPVVWTRELGKGKVAYCSLGHCAEVWKSPQVSAILEQSLNWLASKHDRTST